METIRGRTSLELDVYGLKERLTAGYRRVLLDLGTGDGRYVRTLAGQHPDWFIIGVDACRENLHKYSQVKLQNMLFIIASAQELPQELSGLVSHITVNFPWGSLLEGLLTNDPRLMRGLEAISRPLTSVDVRLNSGALLEAGTTLESGTETIHGNLLQAGWQLETPVVMDANTLRCFPSTWAKRLAFGRDPRAVSMNGRIADHVHMIKQPMMVNL